MENYTNYLIKWLQEQVNSANAKGIIVGVSGGIDSAVVANLIKRAFNDSSLALILPCHSSELDVEDAKKVIEQCKIDSKIINLDSTYNTLITEIIPNINTSDCFQLAKANTKARLRMTTLYAVAQNYGYLVCGTDNQCEWFTGYFTKYGDGGVDIAPLVHLNKSQVYELARYLGVDESIINKVPSAGLIEGVTDEIEMKLTYKQLESFINGEDVEEYVANRASELHINSAHKRDGIKFPKLKLTDFND